MEKILEEKSFMLNKKIMILALVLVSLLTISCVSAAEDGSDALNTISVDGIDDEQAVEASVDDAELGAAEEDDNLQLSPDDFNVTFYGDTFAVEDTAKLLRFYWPDEVPVNDEVIVSYPDEWGAGDYSFWKHTGDTFKDVCFNEIYIFDQGTYDITVSYGDMEIAKTTITVIQKFGPNNFLEIYSKNITSSSDYIANVYDSYNNGKGLEGNVTLTAGGVLVYSELFTGTGLTQKFITTDDLTTTLSGEKFVVVTYQRTANGQSYTKNAYINFVSGEPTGPANTTLYLWYTASKFELEAYLIDDDNSQVIGGAPVVINLDGVNYNLVTNSYGSAKLSTTFLEPGSYTATASYAGSDTYKPSSATTSFVFARTNTSIDFDYNEYYETLYITLLDNANWPVKYADLVINFNGDTYNRKTDVYGCVDLYVGGLASGTYQVNVSYAGNATHNPAFTSYDIIVGSGNPILYCDYYEDTKELAITLTDPFGQTISGADVFVVINGATYDLITDSDGYATLYLSNLTIGTYTADISYYGGYEYGPASISYEFVVSKVDTSISLVYDDVAKELTVTLLNGVTGAPISGASVVVNVGGANYTAKINSKGKGVVSLVDLAPGTYVATASYKGGTKCNPSSTSLQISTKFNSRISAVYDDATKALTVTLVNDANGAPLSGASVVVNVGGAKYTAKINSKGNGVVYLTDLASGTYTATVSYNGGAKCNPSSTKVNVIVKFDSRISAVYDDIAKELTVTLLNDATGAPLSGASVVVNVNGAQYTAKINSKGKGVVSLADLALGNYDVTVSYNGGTKCNPSSTSLQIATKYNSRISAVYNEATKALTVTLVNDANGAPLSGASVVVNVDGKSYTAKINSKGKAVVYLTDLASGNHVANVSYNGGTKCNPSSTTVNVFVKFDSRISAVYDDIAKELTVTLLNDATGAPLSGASVVVNVNGASYTVKINSKGNAVVSLADLAPGTYDVDVSFNGGAKSNPSSTSLQIATKYNSRISAVYNDATEALTVTLVNDATGAPLSGASVVVNVGGVSSTVKVNGAGKGVVYLTNLEPGSYNAAISYNGGTKCNPSSTNVNIVKN